MAAGLAAIALVLVPRVGTASNTQSAIAGLQLVPPENPVDINSSPPATMDIQQAIDLGAPNITVSVNASITNPAPMNPAVSPEFVVANTSTINDLGIFTSATIYEHAAIPVVHMATGIATRLVTDIEVTSPVIKAPLVQILNC